MGISTKASGIGFPVEPSLSRPHLSSACVPRAWAGCFMREIRNLRVSCVRMMVSLWHWASRFMHSNVQLAMATISRDSQIGNREMRTGACPPRPMMRQATPGIMRMNCCLVSPNFVLRPSPVCPTIKPICPSTRISLAMMKSLPSCPSSRALGLRPKSLPVLRRAHGFKWLNRGDEKGERN